MKYIDRLAERKFKLLNGMFQAVLVCGPRQVGKTTMLKHISKDNSRTNVDDYVCRFVPVFLFGRFEFVNFIHLCSFFAVFDNFIANRYGINQGICEILMHNSLFSAVLFDFAYKEIVQL